MGIYYAIKISDKDNIYILYIHIYRNVCSTLVSHLFEQSVLIFSNLCIYVCIRRRKMHECGV